MLTLLPAGLSLAQTDNHTFDVDLLTAEVCLDGARFTGEPSAASSTNLLMTSQIFDDTAATLLATGDTHTFTSVGEQYTFQVSYPQGTFTVGQDAGISVSDIPGTPAGAEGFFGTTTVADCLLAAPPAVAVPMLAPWSMALLVFVLAALAVVVLRR